MFDIEFNEKKNTFPPKIQIKEDSYEGECKDGQPHGLGIYYYAEGNQLEGNFVRG